MKKSQRKLVLSALALTAGIFAIFAFVLRAQETATPVQEGTVSSVSVNGDVSGLSDLEVELQAIEMTTPTPAAYLPQAGTYWSAQHAPGTAEEWPLLPSTFGMGAWSLGEGDVFLLDDLAKNYDAPVKASLKARSGMSAMDVPSPGDGDDSGGGGGASPDFSPSPVDYGTNLWIAQFNQSGGNVSGILSNSIADVEYELQYKTDLLQSNWNSFGFVAGSELTNWTPFSLPMISPTNLFIRARSWQDSTGTGIPNSLLKNSQKV